MRRLLALVLIAAPLSAQTESELGQLVEAFKKERAAAKGPADALILADKLAARAEESRKQENYAAAARYLREARWALPASPAELPDGVRVIGYNRLRHGARANSVAWSHDGSRLLTSSADRTVRVWDAATGRERLVYRGHTPANSDEDAKSGISGVPLIVPDAIFIGDGERAVSAGGKQIHIWDTKTGKTLKTLLGSQRLVKSLAVGESDKILISGGDDKIVRVWDIESGKQTWSSTPHTSRIECVASQAKGRYIAAVDADGFLAVYDPTGKNNSPIMKLQVTDGSNVAAFSVCFTPEGAKVFTGGADKTPRLTPAPSLDGTAPQNAAANSLRLPAHDADVLAVGITSDGKYFVSAGRDKVVRVVDALGQIVRTFTTSSTITALAVRPDGLQIAASCEDGSVRVWDFLANDDHRSATEAKEPLWTCAVSGDGTMFAAAGGDKIVRVYSLTGKLLHTLEAHTKAVTSLVFLPGGKLVSAGGDKTLRLWDAKAGKALGEWPGHEAAVLALAATADGKTVISGGADKTVRAWDTESGKVLWSWTGRSAVTALGISRDASRVLAGTADGGLNLLRIDGGKPVVTGFANAHVSGLAAVTFNPDESRIASCGGDGLPKVWSISASGAPVTLLRLTPALKPLPNSPVALSTIAYSPDGRQIAVGGADQSIRLYDALSGQELRTVRGCTDWVTSLAFAPDGDRLIAVAADKVARIFDVARVEAARRGGHQAMARAVAVSRDGAELASVGEDRSLRLWERESGREIAEIPVTAETLFCVAIAGKHIATGGKDRRLRIWERESKKEISARTIGEVYGITPAPDGSRFAVWSRNNDQEVFGLYPTDAKSEPHTFSESGRKVTCVAFAVDLTLVASGSESGTVQIHDMQSKKAVGGEWKLFPDITGKDAKDKPIVTSSRVVDLGFSPDKTRVIAISSSGSLAIADVAKQKVIATADGPKENINGLLVAPEGERFVLLSEDGHVRFFDYAGKELRVITLPAVPHGAAFTSDGKFLLTANSDGSLCEIVVP